VELAIERRTKMGLFADLLGTTKALFQIEIGGVKLGNSAGNLTVKDNANADADITVKKAFLSGDEIEINSDAAGSGADWKLTLKRPASGMTEAVELTLPPTHGSANQVLKTDGAGVLDWATAGVTTQMLSCDTTDLAWDQSPATKAMVTLPVGAVVEKVRVILDIPFDGTTPATVSVGTAGSASKYMAATQVNLAGTAKDIYESNPGETAVITDPEAVILTFAAASGGTPSAGAARVELHYTIPS
jgi:hypothetical protein